MKASLRNAAWIILAFAVCALWSQPVDEIGADEISIAQLIALLSDSSASVRESAAAQLRRIVAKYPSGTVNLREEDGGGARWREKVQQVKPGMTPADVEEIFGKLPDGFADGSGRSHVQSYHLDHHWRISISYRNSPKFVLSISMPERQGRPISAPIPADFTGLWITWYANGQKASETQMSDGRVAGMHISYHDNGRKWWEQAHTREHKADGPGAGWNRDGSIRYSIAYRDDQRVGKWIYWYANGQKQSEETLIDGKADGPQRRWHENGQLKTEDYFKNGVRDGTEAAWDEAGRLHYKREYRSGKMADD